MGSCSTASRGPVPQAKTLAGDAAVHAGSELDACGGAAGAGGPADRAPQCSGGRTDGTGQIYHLIVRFLPPPGADLEHPGRRPRGGRPATALETYEAMTAEASSFLRGASGSLRARRRSGQRGGGYRARARSARQSRGHTAILRRHVGSRESGKAVSFHGCTPRRSQGTEEATSWSSMAPYREGAAERDVPRASADNGLVVLATISGRMRQFYIRILPGDRHGRSADPPAGEPRNADLK